MTDVIERLYDDRDLIVNSADFESFLETFQGGALKGSSWLKYYYESYKAHPDHYFLKPLMFPTKTELGELFESMECKFTKHGSQPIQGRGSIQILDPDGAFFDIEPRDYHFATVVGIPRPELVEKWIAMWGGDESSLAKVELVNVEKQDKYLLMGHPRNGSGGEWVAMIDRKRIEF